MPQGSKMHRGTIIYIYQHILNESKMRRKNLAMAWIDYKKAYDMIPKARYNIVSKWKPVEWNWQQQEKVSRGKDPKRHIPGECTLNISICDSHNATQPPPPQEMQSRWRTQ